MSHESQGDSSDSETGSKPKHSLGYGFESDSEAQLSGESSDEDSSIEKDDEKDNDDINGDVDDDMFASDGEDRPKPAGKSKLSNIEEFEKENELEPTLTAKSEIAEESEVELEAFNIRQEVESGVLDQTLRYTQKNDSDEDEPWMEGLNKSDILEAKKAQERQSISKRNNHVNRSQEDLIGNLIDLLEPSETLYDALSRLRPKKGLQKAERQLLQNQERKSKVFEITEYCEQLKDSYGISQIYELSREQLMRAFKRVTGKELRGVKRTAEEAGVEQEVGEGAEEDDNGPKIWEFRWIGETEVNGPYSSYEMKYWVDNYFENRVEARKVGLEGFEHISNLTFDD